MGKEPNFNAVILFLIQLVLDTQYYILEGSLDSFLFYFRLLEIYWAFIDAVFENMALLEEKKKTIVVGCIVPFDAPSRRVQEPYRTVDEGGYLADTEDEGVDPYDGLYADADEVELPYIDDGYLADQEDDENDRNANGQCD